MNRFETFLFLIPRISTQLPVIWNDYGVFIRELTIDIFVHAMCHNSPKLGAEFKNEGMNRFFVLSTYHIMMVM